MFFHHIKAQTECADMLSVCAATATDTLNAGNYSASSCVVETSPTGL